MKKDTQLKNIHDLKLLKYKLKADIRLQEEKLGAGLQKLRASYSDQIRTSAIHYSQKIIATLIYRLTRSCFD
ncbi:MAG: hypothetical protein R6W78_14905 [Bacteroidales bacterium]